MQTRLYWRPISFRRVPDFKVSRFQDAKVDTTNQGFKIVSAQNETLKGTAVGGTAGAANVAAGAVTLAKYLKKKHINLLQSESFLNAASGGRDHHTADPLIVEERPSYPTRLTSSEALKSTSTVDGLSRDDDSDSDGDQPSDNDSVTEHPNADSDTHSDDSQTDEHDLGGDSDIVQCNSYELQECTYRQVLGLWAVFIIVFGILGNVLTLLAVPYAAKRKSFVQ